MLVVTVAIQGQLVLQDSVVWPAVSVRVLEPKVLRAWQRPAEMAAMAAMASTPPRQECRVAMEATAEMAATSEMAVMAA